MTNQIHCNEHTLVYDDMAYKWNGKEFYIYKINPANKALELIGKEKNPIIKEWAGIHFARLYMREGVGFRIYIHSQYEQKPDYIDYPIMYDNGQVAWNNPYIIPRGIMGATIQLMKNLRTAEVL